MAADILRHRERFAGDPDALASFELLEEHFFMQGAWPELVDLYAHRLDAPSLAERPAERAHLYVRMGQVLEERCLDPDRAIAAYSEAVRLDPRSLPALRQLRQLYSARGSFEAAIQIAELEEQVPMSASARARLHADVGDVWQKALSDPEQARSHYERAVHALPEHRGGLRGLARTCEELGMWEESACAWTQLAGQLRARGRADALVHAAELMAHHLGRPEGARDCLRQALAEDPEHAAARAFLDEIGPGRKSTAERARAIVQTHTGAGAESERASHATADPAPPATPGDPLPEPLETRDAQALEARAGELERAGRWDELVDALERRAGLAGDASDRAAVFARLGAVHETHTGDLSAARSAYERSLRARPTALEPRTALARLYRKLEAWDELRGLLESLRSIGPTSVRVEALCELGDVLSRHVRDRGAAVAAYVEALALAPEERRALVGIARLDAEGVDEDLRLRAFACEAESTRDRSRLRLLAGHLAQRLEGAGRLEEALVWARRLAEASPEAREPLERVAGLEERLGRDEALAATLERLDPLLAPSERAARRRERAWLHLAAGRATAAIRSLEAVLELEPHDRESLAELVRLLEEAGSLREAAPKRRDLAELLPSPARERCLLELAELHAGPLGEPDAAIALLEALADADTTPDGVATRVGPLLEGLLERAGRFEALAARLADRRARLAPESDEARELALREAAVRLDRLDDAAGAADAARAALDAHPDAPEALDAFECAARAAGDPHAIAHAIALRERAAPDDATRFRFALERGELYERDPAGVAEAGALYRELRERASDESARAAATRRLERLLERRGDRTALCELLEEELPRAPEAERLARHERLAALRRVGLGDLEGSIAHLERATAIAPERTDLWGRLADLLGEAGRPRDERVAIESWIAALEDAPDGSAALLVSVHRRAARVCARALGDPAAAVAHFEAVHAAAPADAEAAAFLVDAYRADGRDTDAADVLERRLAALGPGSGDSCATALRLALAKLRSDALGDMEGAIATLEPELAAPHRVAWVAEPLLALYERAGRTDDRVALAERGGELAASSGERARWRRALGDALRARAQADPARAPEDLERAAAAYRQALEARPRDREVRLALSQIYRDQGEAGRLADLLSSALERESGAAEVALRSELAGLFAGPLEAPRAALAHLQRVLELEPWRSETLARATAIARELGDVAAERALVERALARDSSPSERSRLLVRRAELLEGEGGADDARVECLREALACDPAATELRPRLRALLEQLGRFEDALAELAHEADEACTEARSELFEHGAALAEAHLGPEALLPWILRLWRARPRDKGLLDRAIAAYAALDRHDSVCSLLEKKARLADEPADRVAALCERAHVAEAALSAPEIAIGSLEAARALAPEDPVVLRSLERLYGATRRTRERAEALAALAECAPPWERPLLLLDAGRLFAGELRDPEAALPHLLRVVAEAPAGSPERRDALGVLGEALRSTGRQEAWARAAESEIEAHEADDGGRERAIALRLALARAYESELADPRRAIAHWRALVEELAEGADPSVREEAETAALAHLRRSGETAERAALLARRCARDGAPETGAAARGAEWLELGRLREDAGAHGDAADAYAAALRVDATCLDAIRGLARVAERTGDAAGLARAISLELAAEGALSTSERVARLRRLAAIQRDRLGDADAARSSLETAAELDPDDLDGVRAVCALLEEMGEGRDAIRWYERESRALEAVGGDDAVARRRDIALRIASLARAAGERPRALEAFAHADALSPLAPDRLAEWAAVAQEAGDGIRSAEIFARWCDAPGSGARAADHLESASRLEACGRSDDAIARAERAIRMAPDDARAWAEVGRLRAGAGDVTRASEAFERAAACDRGERAGAWLEEAASLCEEAAPGRALELLERAAEEAPARRTAAARRALLAGRLGRAGEAVEAAEHLLDIAGDAAGLSGAEIDGVVTGARAARETGDDEAAARLFEAVLAHRPDDADALDGRAEALLALGDARGAREALERLLGRGAPERGAATARVLSRLAACCAREGRWSEAVEHQRAALAEEPDCEAARAGLVDALEAARDLEGALGAALDWAGESGGQARAQALVRASELALALGRPAEAGRTLRDVVEAEPEHARAWQLLLRAAEAARDVVGGVESEALARVADPAVRAGLLFQRAALGEDREPDEAALLYAEAVSADARRIDAALAGARLARARGDLAAAERCLASCAERHPGDDPGGLARVWLELGAVRAEREDTDAALDAYRRALVLRPEHPEARDALARLLERDPEHHGEALAQHVEILAEQPANADSLRALVSIAGARGLRDLADDGRAILAALGWRDGDAPTRVGRCSGPPARLRGIFETARRLLRETADELDAVLPPRPPEPDGSTLSGVDRFRLEALRHEGALTSPACAALDDAALAEVISILAQLAAGERPTGDSDRAADLAGVIGPRARRRLHHVLGDTPPDPLRQLDVAAFRRELRRMAHVEALDATDGDLSTALHALVGDATGDGPRRERVAEEASARDLLREVVLAWSRPLCEAAATSPTDDSRPSAEEDAR